MPFNSKNKLNTSPPPPFLKNGITTRSTQTQFKANSSQSKHKPKQIQYKANSTPSKHNSKANTSPPVSFFCFFVFVFLLINNAQVRAQNHSNTGPPQNRNKGSYRQWNQQLKCASLKTYPQLKKRIRNSPSMK